MLQAHRTKKGQVAITDLFISAVLFGMIIISVMALWNQYNKKIVEQTEYNDLLLRGFNIADLLSNYEGQPEKWDELQDVEIIGLANEDRIISKSKLNNFTNLSYEEIKNRFNIVGNEFYFSLSDLTGSDFNPITIGNKTGKQIIDIRRLVIYEDQEAALEFAILE